MFSQLQKFNFVLQQLYIGNTVAKDLLAPNLYEFALQVQNWLKIT